MMSDQRRLEHDPAIDDPRGLVEPPPEVRRDLGALRELAQHVDEAAHRGGGIQQVTGAFVRIGVLPRLERWYDLNIIVEDVAITDKRITAEIDYSLPMSDVLQGMAMTLDLEVEKEGRTIIFR